MNWNVVLAVVGGALLLGLMSFVTAEIYFADQLPPMKKTDAPSPAPDPLPDSIVSER